VFPDGVDVRQIEYYTLGGAGAGGWRGPGRRWRISNRTTGDAYDIIPGAADGVATAMPDWPFPRGDVWILRYHGNEIDDGSVAISAPFEAGLNSWVNGEAINGKDIVIWYRAHFTHDVSHEEHGTFGHTVGPDLKPVKW
jgi:Cu2+-containing amine oxidase